MERIDNIDKVIPFLIFENEGDFYYLQILQRKKENPQLGSNSRVIKNYYIDSVEYLQKHYDEIKMLCEQFNARASIRLNRRNYEKVAYKAMVNIANSMNNREFSFIKKSYDRAVGNGHAEPKDSKTWILDIDGDINPTKLNSVKALVNMEQPVGDKILAEIPSKSGIHLITKPFDLRQFRVVLDDIEIHKDNPTNLYL